MNQSLYIYGIAKGERLPSLLEGADSSIFTVPSMGCSAIVSERDGTEVGELDRESLAHLLLHHQKTLEALMDGGVQLIPLKLGTMVATKDDAAALIGDGYGLFSSIFRETEGVHEQEVVARWSRFPDLLQELASEPEVLELRAAIEARGSTSTEDAIALGRLMKEKIERRNAAVAGEVFERLAAEAAASRRHDAMDDEMVLNAAFLVGSGHADAFVEAVEELDRRYAQALDFRIVGPLPCYSFCTVEVRALTPAAVDGARRTLGLGAGAGEEELRQAFRSMAMASHPDRRLSGGTEDGTEFSTVREAYVTLSDYFRALADAAPGRKPGADGRIFSVKKAD